MLSESTRKRIKERKTLKHSNPSQFLKRVKDQSNDAIKDLTLIAKNLEEEHLEEIFTAKQLESLVLTILKPKNQRTIEITEMLSNRVFQKLIGEFPPDVVNEISPDIGKTWTYAKLASYLWNRSNIK